MNNYKLHPYYRFLNWWQNEVIGRWTQFVFNCGERWKSTRYSLSVMKWHKPCIECWGSGISVKYRQEQECRMGCGVGYQRTRFWGDMKDIFYPSQKLYNFKCWLKRTFRGCSLRDPHIWHEYCRFGTCGCTSHPRTHDWQGKPLTSKP